MTVAKPISNFLPSLSDLGAAVLERFRPVPVAVEMPAPAAKLPADDPTATDPSGYERLLENELDRQHLTAVEREDMDMLDRVRDALYADD